MLKESHVYSFTEINDDGTRTVTTGDEAAEKTADAVEHAILQKAIDDAE